MSWGGGSLGRRFQKPRYCKWIARTVFEHSLMDKESPLPSISYNPPYGQFVCFFFPFPSPQRRRLLKCCDTKNFSWFLIPPTPIFTPPRLLRTDICFFFFSLCNCYCKLSPFFRGDFALMCSFFCFIGTCCLQVCWCLFLVGIWVHS